jgi:hypothetical protein
MRPQGNWRPALAECDLDVLTCESPLPPVLPPVFPTSCQHPQGSDDARRGGGRVPLPPGMLEG